jgi:WD40 repeat protein
MTEPVLTSLSSLPGKSLADHELIRRIGRGSYGDVWLARSATGAYRAIKIVRRESFEHDRPFEREFSGITRFEPISRKHESQMDVLHVGRGDGYFYYVMELADDQFTGQQINPETYAPRTLKSELFQHEKLPFEECIQLSLALTTALEHLHKNGLVHRDVKPSNVIFVNGVPKLADIGLVTPIDATRSFVGTEGFAPPEGPGTAQADIYSLGKVLYEMATGKDRQDFPELPTNIAALPESEALIELNAVIVKACRQNPNERYTSANEMHRDLLLLQSGKSLAKLRLVERRLQSLKRWSVVVLAFTILVSGAFLYEARQSRVVRRLVEEKDRMLDEKTALAYATDVKLAQVALTENNLGRALEILDRQHPRPGEPDLRGWEWRYLWGQCRSDSFSSLPQRASWVRTVAFSPGGNWLAAAEVEGRIRIWDLKARSDIATFESTEPFCAFSPAGPVVAFVSQNLQKTNENDVILWNVESRRTEGTLMHNGHVGGFAFAGGGKWLVTIAFRRDLDQSEINVWSVEERKVVKSLIRGGRSILSTIVNNLVVSGDMSVAAYATADTLHVLNLNSSVERWKALAAEEHIQAMAISDDAKILATGEGWAESDIRFWDVSTGKETERLKGHTGFVGALAFRNKDTELLSASGDQTIRLWDVPSGGVKRVFRGHHSEVWTFAVAPNQPLLASGGKDGAICLWDLGHDPGPRDIRLPGTYKSWWFAADGSRMITIATNGVVTEWHASDFSNPKILGSLGPQDRSPLISPDGRCLMTGNTNGIVRIRAVQDFQILHEFSVGEKNVHPYLYTRKGKLVWIGDFSTDSFHCFDVETWSPVKTLNVKGIQAFDCSEDGRWVVIVSLEGHGRRFDLSTGLESEQDLGIIDVSDVSFSPDAKLFALASTRGIVRIFETGTFHEIFTVRSFLLGVTSVMFSPDGRSIFAGNPGGGYALKAWDIRSQQEILSLPGKGSDFRPITFSADGTLLGTLNSKGKLHLWRAPSLLEIRESEDAPRKQ